MNHRPPSVSIARSLWVRSARVDPQPVWKGIRDAFVRRDIECLILRGPDDTENLERIRHAAWKTDRHIILHGLMADELRALQPVFAQRRNFSLVLIDWWASPAWFNLHADYLVFHFFNGIAVRRGLTGFLPGPAGAPGVELPERWSGYTAACLGVRAASLVAWPALDLVKRRAQKANEVPTDRLFYFPLPIAPDQLQLRADKPEIDFASMGASVGYWVMRDAYASARYHCANLYADRRQIVETLHRLGDRFRIYDRRQVNRFLSWEDWCGVIGRSRYAISTGGLHAASIPKYMEYICLGTPVLGTSLPHEFPWLDDCLIEWDPLERDLSKVRRTMEEALDRQPVLRAKCLATRELLVRLYDPERLLDMLQAQYDGQPVPDGYLKPSAGQSNIRC